MGSVKIDLCKKNLPDREKHNSRMFIDLAENIHIHHREFRTVFSINEFLEYCDILEKSKISALEYLENNVNYKEHKYPTTLFPVKPDALHLNFSSITLDISFLSGIAVRIVPTTINPTTR